MKPDTAHTTAAAEAAAARWMACHDRGLSDAERAAFARWLAADPIHAKQWHRTETLWAELARLHPETSVRAARRTGLVPLAWVALAASAVLGAALLPWQAPPKAAAPAVVRFSAPQDTERRVELADGSVAIMQRGSHLAFGDFAEARRVRLLSGEAHFTVSKSSDKPFFVHAGPVAVRDIGTAFFVGLAADGVQVLVTEGQVEVSASASSSSADARDPSRQVLSEGQQTVVAATAARNSEPHAASRHPYLEAVSAATPAMGTWKSRRLVFERTPLAEVVEQLNRYNVRQVLVTDPGTGRLPLSGALQSDNLDAFARLLEDGFELRVRLLGERQLTVGAR